ncbi:MAG TPA: hypothetical protein VL947_03095 [Cytophagales bacterium]|nr:hypothetical protein [Cytophagales bacterium]
MVYSNSANIQSAYNQTAKGASTGAQESLYLNPDTRENSKDFLHVGGGPLARFD